MPHTGFCVDEEKDSDDVVASGAVRTMLEVTVAVRVTLMMCWWWRCC